MKIIKENIFLFFISNSFASLPPSSEIGDWVLENSSYTINAATITVHGDVYVKTTSTISIETGGNLKIGRFWTKRIPITISTSVSPDIPDDYQIWVPTTAFTTAQWSDIKGGTGQADLDDVRFVSSMNATGYWESCPYWIEPDTNNPKGFWVKISSINQANSNVYMYYGNADEVSISNGDATFMDYIDNDDIGGWALSDGAMPSISAGAGTSTRFYSLANLHAFAYHLVSVSEENFISETRFKTANTGRTESGCIYTPVWHRS